TNSVAELETRRNEQTISNNAIAECGAQNKSVLLLCKEVTLINPEVPRKRIRAVAFFDAGSQLSFITSKFAERLGLRGEKEKELNVASFGSKRPSACRVKKTKVGIETRDKDVCVLDVNTIDYLINKLQMICISDEEADEVAWKTQLCGLQQKWEEPELLVGADFFFKFIEPKKSRKTRSVFHLLHTKIGLMLSGSGHIKGTPRSTKTQSESVFVFNTVKLENEVDNF
ncbi:unnamed protein product, partial [Gongylonema pulchrum]|uniref:DUF1758 domain-containing protein n=1 Tax=Gongylonema pulchrum TaxID=637853 RepID=A0A183E5E5_9BILA